MYIEIVLLFILGYDLWLKRFIKGFFGIWSMTRNFLSAFFWVFINSSVLLLKKKCFLSPEGCKECKGHSKERVGQRNKLSIPPWTWEPSKGIFWPNLPITAVKSHPIIAEQTVDKLRQIYSILLFKENSHHA